MTQITCLAWILSKQFQWFVYVEVDYGHLVTYKPFLNTTKKRMNKIQCTPKRIFSRNTQNNFLDGHFTFSILFEKVNTQYSLRKTRTTRRGHWHHPSSFSHKPYKVWKFSKWSVFNVTGDVLNNAPSPVTSSTGKVSDSHALAVTQSCVVIPFGSPLFWQVIVADASFISILSTMNTYFIGCSSAVDLFI